MSDIGFGIQIEPQYGFTYSMIKDIAKTAESLGFESIWLSDHFFMTDDSINTHCLECWTTLAALACDTQNIKIGPMVSAQSYRNPALLAKIAATLDHICNGRSYFGIGAGWKETEYKAYGYNFPKPAIRIKQLEETIQIVKLMWTEKKANFKGKHYNIQEALCYPHPVQKPHIPIWVGGTGKLTLKVAAKHADAINFAWTQTPEFFRDKLQFLKRLCKKIGREYDEVKKSAGLMITMAENEKSLKQTLEMQKEKMDTPYMRYLSRQSPNLIGLPEEIGKKISDYLALGIEHFILRFHFDSEIKLMKLFMDKVKKHI